MPVYVDPLFGCIPNARWRWDKACHLFADTIDELHEFAKKVGLKRVWFQPGRLPHYDLTEKRRAKAIQLGVIPLTRKEAVSKWKEIRQ
jgi:hypothetical protein